MASEVCVGSHGLGLSLVASAPPRFHLGDITTVTSSGPEVLPHFVASWGPASMLGLGQGPRDPTVPLSLHLVSGVQGGDNRWSQGLGRRTSQNRPSGPLPLCLMTESTPPSEAAFQ